MCLDVVWRIFKKKKKQSKKTTKFYMYSIYFENWHHVKYETFTTIIHLNQVNRRLYYIQLLDREKAATNLR